MQEPCQKPNRLELRILSYLLKAYLGCLDKAWGLLCEFELYSCLREVVVFQKNRGWGTTALNLQNIVEVAEDLLNNDNSNNNKNKLNLYTGLYISAIMHCYQ